MTNIQTITLTTEARQVQALFKLVQRTAMSDAEACFVEDLFSGWFAQVQDQRNQMQALARVAELANRAPAEAVDQPTQESPPGAPSEPLPYDGVTSTIN